MRNFTEEFKNFKIDERNYPNYDSLKKFAGQFKKCSLYKYNDITYSNSSSAEQQLCKIEKEYK